jgi:cellulose biosynthesis protein BcsQ
VTIVVIAGTKGGTGKTTTAVALAFEAEARGDDVLVLDLDPQQTAREWAPDMTRTLAATDAGVIRDAAGDHRLVLLDVPPGATPAAVAALEAADVVVAVTGLGPGDMRGLTQLLRMVDADLIVPTRWDRRRTLHTQALDALRSRWPDQLTEAIPMAASVERAQAGQEPLPVLSPPGIAYRSVYGRLQELVTSLTADAARTV